MTERYVKFATNTSTEFNHNQFMMMNDYELEGCHHFIQWIFPLAESSKFNPDCPVIDIVELRKAILEKNEITITFMQSVDVMLNFWGIKSDGENFLVEDVKKLQKLKSSNHNTLRFSRLLRSLVYHGHSRVASNLLKWILTQPVVPGYDIKTGKSFWELNFIDATEKENRLMMELLALYHTVDHLHDI